MDLEKVFKNLVILDFLFFIFVTVEMLFFQSEEVATISDQLSFGIFNTDASAMIGGVFAIILLIIYLISFLLLYSFKYFGKYLFTLAFIVGILFSLVAGPAISTSLGYTLDWLEGAIEGAILILLYFSPIKDKFIKQ